MQIADAGHCLQSFKTYLKVERTALRRNVSSLSCSPRCCRSGYTMVQCRVGLLRQVLKNSGVFRGYGEVYLKNATEIEITGNLKDLVREMVDRFSRRVVAAREGTISFT
ncbi:hypothetical protein IV203_035231 [Nitzschia inconspicua]|uniref:Uncharacterized protein n=1 Tax=Nitzschia inconspicua TaxID=303405 RepID=A0A9K3PUE5_9STRA|nr:hypothetical protein IV203_035231 [Nitzschia inconspicua]